MRKHNGELAAVSSPTWETLEVWARVKIQEFVQGVLEEEVSELLGRQKSERRALVDSAAGYRNGYGKPRRLAMSNGTITVRRPRVRGLEERFESRILPLVVRRTKEVGELLPALYLHGLAQGDFELALRRCRALRSGGCGGSGRSSPRPGAGDRWTSRTLCICGQTGSM